MCWSIVDIFVNDRAILDSICKYLSLYGTAYPPTHTLCFAGHVARIQAYDQGRLTVEPLHWINKKWIDIVAASNGGRQLHCRKLKVWRWERTLVK